MTKQSRRRPTELTLLHVSYFPDFILLIKDLRLGLIIIRLTVISLLCGRVSWRRAIVIASLRKSSEPHSPVHARERGGGGVGACLVTALGPQEKSF